MIQRILLFQLLFISFNIQAEKPFAPELLEGATVITTEEIITLITSKPELVIIDSRRNEEYKKGHIEGSIALLDKTMTLKSLKNIAPNHNTPLLFYCNGIRCMRSYNASIKAISWGYTNIYWFRGGWKEWKAKEMPISQ